jgi:hypothetical protein
VIDNQDDLAYDQSQDRRLKKGADLYSMSSQHQRRGDGDDVEGKEEEYRRRQNLKKLVFDFLQNVHHITPMEGCEVSTRKFKKPAIPDVPEESDALLQW